MNSRRVLLIVAVVATVAVLLLHWRAYQHAGALWRDEVNGVNVSRAAPLGELWSQLEFESFPLVWPLMLRGWGMIGLGDEVMQLRLLSLLVGVGSCGAYWLAARAGGMRAPVFLLSLLAVHPLVLHWGDSLRAYGLGAATVALATGAMWSMLNRPTRGRVLWTLVAWLLCAHAVYFNAFILLALGAGAAAVAMRRKQWSRLALVLAVGGTAAISMLPYLTVARRIMQWNMLLQLDVTAAELWETFSTGLSVAHPWGAACWVVVAGGTVLSAVLCRRSDAALFAGVATIAGTILFASVLLWMGRAAFATHYIILMALIAACADLALGTTLDRWDWGRWSLVAAAGIFITATWPAAWAYSEAKYTNVDVIAAGLREDTAANDLVIVTHWTVGISFDYYYPGPAKWTTLPPLSDHRVHRLDLVKQAIAEADPLASVREAMSRTLEAGGRVFLVRMDEPTDQAPSPALPPAPHGPTKWMLQPYLDSFRAQTDQWLGANAESVEHFSVKDDPRVTPAEKIRVITIARGLRSR